MYGLLLAGQRADHVLHHVVLPGTQETATAFRWTIFKFHIFRLNGHSVMVGLVGNYRDGGTTSFKAVCEPSNRPPPLAPDQLLAVHSVISQLFPDNEDCFVVVYDFYQ